MRTLQNTLILVALTVALAACSDSASTSGGAGDVDPGRCTITPDLDPRWLASRSVIGADVSCQYVVWLAPATFDEDSSTPQVYVHDLANDLTFRTTDGDGEDRVAPIGVARWSPALHGFWLAYAEGNTIVAENLRDLERATFEARPHPNGTVDVYFPWAVWENVQEGGNTVIMAGHLVTGEMLTVSDPTTTAMHPVVDDGRVAYTVWADDTDGPANGLTGTSTVFIATPGADDTPRPVYTGDGATGRAGLYDDLLTYVLEDTEGTHLVAMSATSLTEIGFIDVPLELDTWPRVGHGVVTWPAADKPAYVAWWPYMGQLDEVQVDASASSARITIGEFLILAVVESGEGSALWIDRIAPQ